MNEILSLSTGEDEKVFLRERSFFSGKIRALALTFKVNEIDVAQLFAKEQDFLLKYYGGTLPKNVSVDNPAIELIIWHSVKLNLELDASKALAFTDALTGLGNRYIFDDELKRKVKQYARSTHFPNSITDDDNFSLILFDLDKFKSVNDTFGHNVGDKVLKEVAGVALEHIRSTDTLVRYGGEEFAIIVTGEIRAACLLAERIRESIEKINVEKLGINPDARSSITASFGVSQYVWLGEQETSIELLKKNADIRLYKAKNSGRNQVVSSDF